MSVERLILEGLKVDLTSPTDRLCRSCPWDWTTFQGSCYFFSVVQKSWNDSATACHNMGAQLVVIKSDEEQVGLVRPSPQLRMHQGYWLKGEEVFGWIQRSGKETACLEREDKKIIKETRAHAKRHTLGLERRLSG